MPAFLTIFLFLAALVCSAGTEELTRKFHTLAVYRTIRADFIQTRRLTELDMTIEIRGEMVCEKNGRLRWQVNSPVRSVTVIADDTLTHFDAETGKTSRIEQRKFPWLKVLRSCLTDWISGDPERLAKRFELTAKDERTLRLTPKEAALKNMFRSVEIRADAAFAAIETIAIEETSGDILTIRFVNVRKDPAGLSDKTWRAAPE
ncbi:MAG: outer membrane lipoprotein carrier protein LolA [Lentisphaeria bacterium]|nr:outer membrane lipoprotein carrier protein LolA [Lentisphaeria bacterium]